MHYLLTQKQRVQHWQKIADHYDEFAFLQNEVAKQLLSHLQPIKLQARRMLELGASSGYLARQLTHVFPKTEVDCVDIAYKQLKNNRRQKKFFSKQKFVCADACALPFVAHSYDAVIANLLINWLPIDLLLAEVKRVLKPNGLLLLTAFGPDTLIELRRSFAIVDEQEHINQFLDIHDLGDKVTQAGFSAPVLDVSYFQLLYQDLKHLLRELKGFGSFKLIEEPQTAYLGKNKLKAVEMHYQVNPQIQNKLPATFEIIFAHAWQQEKNDYVDQKADFSILVSDIIRTNKK